MSSNNSSAMNEHVVEKATLQEAITKAVDEALARKNCLLRKDGFIPLQEILGIYKCRKEVVHRLINDQNLNIRAEHSKAGKDGRILFKNVWVNERDFVNKYFAFKSFVEADKRTARMMK